jgi:hypothetical protein
MGRYLTPFKFICKFMDAPYSKLTANAYGKSRRNILITEDVKSKAHPVTGREAP